MSRSLFPRCCWALVLIAATLGLTFAARTTEDEFSGWQSAVDLGEIESEHATVDEMLHEAQELAHRRYRRLEEGSSSVSNGFLYLMKVTDPKTNATSYKVMLLEDKNGDKVPDQPSPQTRSPVANMTSSTSIEEAQVHLAPGTPLPVANITSNNTAPSKEGGPTTAPPTNSTPPPPAVPCMKRSHGRGIGTIPTRCNEGEERAGLLCYKKCPENYTRVGCCWCRRNVQCPDGYKDHGATCMKPTVKGRGAGYPWKFGDKPFNFDAAKERCEKDHGTCEKWGLIYYPQCKAGYAPKGCCLCEPTCPEHTKDRGVFCEKEYQGGGAPLGGVSGCDEGRQNEAGLCYKKCRTGYTGLATICWQQCPAYAPHSCGAICTADKFQCGKLTGGFVGTIIGGALLGVGGAGVVGAVSAVMAAKTATAAAALSSWLAAGAAVSGAASGAISTAAGSMFFLFNPYCEEGK